MSVCETVGSDREELKRYPPPSPAALRIVNVHERKPRQKKNTRVFAVFIVKLGVIIA